MSASKDQSSLNQARGAGTTFGPNDGASSSTATPEMSVTSTIAAGHGDHLIDNADGSNVTIPSSKMGPPQEDLQVSHSRQLSRVS